MEQFQSDEVPMDVKSELLTLERSQSQAEATSLQDGKK